MQVKTRGLMVHKMELHPEKCSGCMLCLMACSLKYEGVVNPLKARSKLIKKDSVQKIILTEDCTFCGHCVTVCHYGARKLKEVS